MSDRPLVSVIALCFNQERWVLETLESIRNQSLRDFELIFCDDASADNSVGVAMEWLNQQAFPIDTILHQENRGVCRTLNEALDRCRGEFVQVIASDDILKPTKLEQQVDILSRRGDSVAICCGNLRSIDAAGAEVSPYMFPEDYEFPKDPFAAMLSGPIRPIWAPTVLFRSSTFSSVGRFDESLRVEDLDMWLRVTSQFEVAFVPDILVDYRIHDASFSHGTEHKNTLLLDKLAVMAKWLDHPKYGQLARGVFVSRVRQAIHDKEFMGSSDARQGLETWIAHYSNSSNGRTRRGMRWLLKELLWVDGRFARQLMDQHSLSTGSRLTDTMYRLATRIVS